MGAVRTVTIKPVLREGDTRIFTLDDVKRLYMKSCRTLCRSAVIGAVLALCFLLRSGPKFKAEASFREAAEKKGGEGALGELLGGIGVAHQQAQATALMKSHHVLRPLVERFGLQANVIEQGRWSALMTGAQEKLQIELGRQIPEIDRFVFANVHYQGEQPLSFRLTLQDETYFALHDASGRFLRSGQLGRPCVLKDVTFTLVAFPHAVQRSRTYDLTIDPWFVQVGYLQGAIKVVPHKMYKGVLA
ncbi:MAG: hypothetical protein RL235_940, partial [Chlamydiota bacterium]